MIAAPYPFIGQNRNKLYFFESHGSKKVMKAVQFTHVYDRIYNLGLADVANGKLNFRELAFSDDSWKVFNTVAAITIQFAEFYPDARILIRAADEKRLNLYNLIFQRRIKQIETFFEVFGFLDYKADVSEPFQVGVKYEAFIVKRKNPNS